jgi:subtilisin family serine protease
MVESEPQRAGLRAVTRWPLRWLKPAASAIALVAALAASAAPVAAQTGTGSSGSSRSAGSETARPQLPTARRLELAQAATSRPARPRRATQAPPADERRYVSDEVIIELDGAPSPQEVEALARRHRLSRIESRVFPLSRTTMYRWHIPDGRSVATVVRELEADGAVLSVQPNYTYTTQEQIDPGPLQYAIPKLNVREAQALSRGNNIRVAVIDSGIDVSHPELAGEIEASFDVLGTNEKPNPHGTGVAGVIVGHLRLTGVAPGARLLAVRAFAANTDGEGTQASTFNIIKALDWTISQRAHVINMSFAGPPDPATARLLASAAERGIVLVAAAGNNGPRSPPMFPASDPNVIAVSATDASDRLFKRSSPGAHIAIAAPGVDIVVAVPNAGYGLMTGTSFAAPFVSGIAALMLARNPALTPGEVRKLLIETAHDLGSPGRDDQYGAGLTDALRAVTAADPKTVRAISPIPAAAQ